MNRSFKTLVVTMLALSLSLSFGTALAKQKKQTPKKPAQVAVETLTISLTDKAGNTLSADASTGAYALISGHRYLIKAAVTPEGAKSALRYRSNKPRVASVSNRGVVYVNRAGTAAITVTAKNGAVKQTITVNVAANVATFDTTADKTVKRIYLKGNILCMDVVLVDSSTEAMTAAPDLEFFLKLPGESDATSQGVKSGRLRAPIAAGESGTAVYRIKKVNSGTISLPGATASCTMP
jgi:hypothetical protein